MKSEGVQTMRSCNLETLLWVVRLGGVSAAAERLHLTQPAVTRRIQELERDLDIKLFRRVGRTLTPTAAAKAMLPRAERVLSEIAAMSADALSAADFRGKLRVGIAELIGLTWIDRFVRRLEESFPGLSVDIEVEVASKLIEGLNRRKLDVIFLPGTPRMNGVSRVEIGSRALRWISHPDLVRATNPGSPETLAGSPIILMPKGAEWHDVVMDWFVAADVKPERVRTCNSVGVLTALVRKGLGVTAMPIDLVEKDLASGALVLLPEGPALPCVSYCAAYMMSEAAAIMPQVVAIARTESRFMEHAALDV